MLSLFIATRWSGKKIIDMSLKKEIDQNDDINVPARKTTQLLSYGNQVHNVRYCYREKNTFLETDDNYLYHNNGDIINMN